MNKEEIWNKLESLDLDKDEYIIISGASLVVHGLLDKTSDIDLSCSKEFYEQVDWKSKDGLFDTTIKYKDVFEIGPNFYWLDDIDVINGFRFMGLKNCLKLKLKENKEKDKDVIKKLQKIVGKED
jgi:hypothetical protein